MPANTARKEEGEAQNEENAAAKKPALISPRDPELPPLQEWIDQQYKGLKKEFHGTREKILESQPNREPYMPYCFNSLFAYTNTDVPQYCLYKRYEENPSAYCQRRTAIRLTDPEESWAMDNVLFLSDYELYYKPIIAMEEEDEQVEEEQEEGAEGAEEEDGEEGAKKEKEPKTVKKEGKSTQKAPVKPKPKQSKSKEANDGGEKGEDETGGQEEQEEEKQRAVNEKESQRRKEKEEQDYRRAKEIWIASSFDYIFDKPEKTQNSLLAALRQNRRFLKDIKKSIWERLVNDRREAFKKMVQWKKEQEGILRHGKPTNKSERDREGESEEKEEGHEQKQMEQEQESEN